jgi:hypothetical protein
MLFGLLCFGVIAAPARQLFLMTVAFAHHHVMQTAEPRVPPTLLGRRSFPHMPFIACCSA